jgi:hydrogenase-4 component E
VIDFTTWATIGLGLGIVVLRRRSMAIALLALQSGAVGLAAIVQLPTGSADALAAMAVLVVKATVLPGLLTVVVLRSRESSPVRAGVDPLVRLGITLAAVLTANLLVPELPGLGQGQRGAVALVSIGIATVVLRRATILQLVGILVAENGLALAAISVPGGMPVVIDLGALFDLIVVTSVAIVFHRRIYAVLGSGDSALLRELRD